MLITENPIVNSVLFEFVDSDGFFLLIEFVGC